MVRSAVSIKIYWYLNDYKFKVYQLTYLKIKQFKVDYYTYDVSSSVSKLSNNTPIPAIGSLLYSQDLYRLYSMGVYEIDGKLSKYHIGKQYIIYLYKYLAKQYFSKCLYNTLL